MDNSLICFLQKMLQDTVSLNFNHLSPPFFDVSGIDIGLRKGLKDSEKLYQTFINIMDALEAHCFYFFQDAYQLNYIFFRPLSDKKDVATLGPFLKQSVDRDYIGSIIQAHHLTHNEIESIRALFHQIPVLDDNTRLISIMVNIVNYLEPDAPSFRLEETSSTQEEPEVHYIPVDNYMINAQATEARYSLEEPLLQAISQGNVSKALELTRRFKSMLYEPRLTDALHDTKAALYSVNTFLRIGVARAHVHPIFIHELSGMHVKMISQASSNAKLNEINEVMVKNYCKLVQEKSRSRYSKLIQDCLNYIDFNISQPLSLSVLSDYLHTSASYLSMVFKKELGITLTDHIVKQRIQASLKLLDTTNMQIQEVAAYVGIVDFNYYTKLFKRCIGCAPSEYRKRKAGRPRRDN